MSSTYSGEFGENRNIGVIGGGPTGGNPGTAVKTNGNTITWTNQGDVRGVIN